MRLAQGKGVPERKNGNLSRLSACKIQKTEDKWTKTTRPTSLVTVACHVTSYERLRKTPSNLPPRFHFDRTVGCDCNYCHFGGHAASGSEQSQTKSLRHDL